MVTRQEVHAIYDEASDCILDELIRLDSVSSAWVCPIGVGVQGCPHYRAGLVWVCVTGFSHVRKLCVFHTRMKFLQINCVHT
jgi:hypothetical protein